MKQFMDYFTLNNIIAVIIGVIAIVWLFCSIWRNYKIRQIASWPTVHATVVRIVIATDIHIHKIETSDDAKRMIAKLKTGSVYYPSISYKYVVGGEEYKSSNMSFTPINPHSSEAIKMMMRNIVPGSKMMIRYNPAKPSEAYIYTSEPSYMGVILSLLLLLLAATIAYYPKMAKQKKMTDISLTTEQGAENKQVVKFRRPSLW